MDSATDDRAAREVRTFASAVVHELRTPLSALSAEVDIALRRDRPAAAYREALGRIQRRVAELAEFGCDLAWLAQPLEAAAESGVASLDALLASVVQRSSTLRGTLSRDGTDAQVHGDEQALNRGIWLLVEHAMRYRLEDAAVRISVGRTAPTDLHVFVNITAAWCLTCLVNERVALRTPAVEDVFARKGVVMLKADWTRRDPVITQVLGTFGRNGVPLYLFYPAGGATREPAVLPQILSERILIDATKEVL